jgi:multiple sugar transport system substrate-binding protein
MMNYSPAALTRSRDFFLFALVLLLFPAGACRRHPGKDGPLLFWVSNNPREITMCDTLTAEWNRAHPADGSDGEAIHLQPIPEGQSSEEVILAAVVGKTTPDIYANMWQGNVEMFAASGVLVPLDTLAGFLSFIHERCDSAVIKEITSADGHIYQVPWKVNPIMTIYNKTIFTRNGLSALPRTYSAYRQAAAICKAKGVKWFGYTEVKEIWYQRLFNFYPLYLAASGGAPLILHNRAAFNNKYAVEVFAFLQSLYRDGFFSRENLSAADDPFAGQAIVTKWTGPWEIPYLDGLPDRNFDFEWFEPQVPDDHQGPVYTYADPKNIVVFSTCTRPQAAWDFIRTLVDRRGDLQLLAVTGQLPRRAGLLTDPYYNDYFKRNPMMEPFARELPFVKGVDNCEVIVEVLDIISQEYESCVVYGKKEPAAAIRDAETAVNILLASNTKQPAHE